MVRPLDSDQYAQKASIYTFSDKTAQIPARHGFALRDAMEASLRHGGTQLGSALDSIKDDYDRIVVVTDEQSHDRVPAPKGRGYMINVASAKNGVGYGAWAHIDGWSEAVVEYIRELEQSEAQ